MKKDQVLILDCHGETRPAICFSLEVADYDMRVVTEEDEAINLLDNARLIDEKYVGFLVNNPYMNVDISKLVLDVERIDHKMPVLFVKHSLALKRMVEALSVNCRSRIYHTEPTGLVELLNELRANGKMKTSTRSSRLVAKQGFRSQ